jgi:hypothetical protein
MRGELKVLWPEAVVLHFEVLSWYLFGGTKENHK